MSIALEVGRLAEERLGPAAAPQLVTVGLEVGDDAGVEVGSLEFCLEAVLATPPFRGARPAIARCGGDILRVAYFEVDDGRPDD
jgi:Zn finger protein HypA/HybF involved in hydrogenase expression